MKENNMCQGYSDSYVKFCCWDKHGVISREFTIDMTNKWPYHCIITDGDIEEKAHKKPGDIVTIFDGSYNYVVQPDGSLKHVEGLAVSSVQYVIVATNVNNLPIPSNAPCSSFNNTIIRRCFTNEIVFIREGFLRFENRCECCGKNYNEERNKGMKAGDKVRIKDRSFHVKVHSNGNVSYDPDLQHNDVGMIVCCGLTNLPSSIDGIYNDTILKKDKDGSIIFIKKVNLAPIIYCKCCGKEINKK